MITTDLILEETASLLNYYSGCMFNERELYLGAFFRLVFKSLTGRNPSALEWDKIQELWIGKIVITSQKIRCNIKDISNFCYTVNPERHLNRVPDSQDGPLIAIQIKENKRIIDGTTRICYWLEHDVSKEFFINLHILDGVDLRIICSNL